MYILSQVKVISNEYNGAYVSVVIDEGWTWVGGVLQMWTRSYCGDIWWISSSVKPYGHIEGKEFINEFNTYHLKETSKYI